MLAITFELRSYLEENWPELLDGLVNSLEVAGIAIVGVFFIGAVLGAARAHRIPVVSQFAAVYVEVIRNTPLLVQIFMLFYGLAQLGVHEVPVLGTIDFRLDAFDVGWLSLMIWGGAFNTENFRAGFLAVPYRYREAGLALGFSRLRTFLNITLPIGGRIALPASINTNIAVLKNTSLLYVIAFAELTFTAYQINSDTLQTTETFFVLGVTYLVIVWTLSALIRLLESHLALPERH